MNNKHRIKNINRLIVYGVVLAIVLSLFLPILDEWIDSQSTYVHNEQSIATSHHTAIVSAYEIRQSYFYKQNRYIYGVTFPPEKLYVTYGQRYEQNSFDINGYNFEQLLILLHTEQQYGEIKPFLAHKQFVFKIKRPDQTPLHYSST